jgi:hypothetical protein
MAAIADVAAIAAKWSRITSQRGPDYEAGVRSPRRGWQAATKASTSVWEQGVANAVQGKMFDKGVSATPDSVWLGGAIDKGVRRFAEGVALAQNKYATNFAPYADTIRGVNLPPRKARRDPANLERVSAITKALAARKTGIASR